MSSKCSKLRGIFLKILGNLRGSAPFFPLRGLEIRWKPPQITSLLGDALDEIHQSARHFPGDLLGPGLHHDPDQRLSAGGPDQHPAGTRQGILLPLHGGRQLLGGHDPLLHAAAVGDLLVDEDLGIGRADGGQLAGLLPGPGQDL